MPYQNDPALKRDSGGTSDLREGAELARHPGWRRFGVAMLGAGIGLGAGLLLAPASGATARGKVRRAASRAKSKMSFHRGNGAKDLAGDAASALKGGAQDLRRAENRMEDRSTF